MDKENEVLEKIFDDLYEEYKKHDNSHYIEVKIRIIEIMLKIYAAIDKPSDMPQ